MEKHDFFISFLFGLFIIFLMLLTFFGPMVEKLEDIEKRLDNKVCNECHQIID